MSRKAKPDAAASEVAHPQFSGELVGQLIPGPVTPAELEYIFSRIRNPLRGSVHEIEPVMYSISFTKSVNVD
jgi:hypothetical protein